MVIENGMIHEYMKANKRNVIFLNPLKEYRTILRYEL